MVATIQPLYVGPIIGMKENNNKIKAFVFGRGEPGKDGNTNIYGVIRIKAKEQNSTYQYYVKKMEASLDWSCGIEIIDLEPDTEYAYQFGWVGVAPNSEEDNFLKNPGVVTSNNNGVVDWNSFDWHLLDKFQFQIKTLSLNPQSGCSVVLGSCRWMLQNPIVSIANKILPKGLTIDEGHIIWFKTEADAIYKQIFNKHKENPLTQIILCGDQIYADYLSDWIYPTVETNDYYRLYKLAFSQENIKNLMARIPTFMIMDDHEFKNEFPECNDSPETQSQRSHKINAIKAYQIYQDQHNPTDKKQSHPTGDNDISNTFWYSYQDGCADFFVMDLRTECNYDKENPQENKIISNEQENALIKWLSKDIDKVKCIVSSTPLFPRNKREPYRYGDYYYNQRNKILEKIAQENLKKVIFLSGDFHCSMTSILEGKDTDRTNIIQIISSPLYEPDSTHLDSTSILDWLVDGSIKRVFSRILNYFGGRKPDDFEYNEKIQHFDTLTNSYKEDVVTPSKIITNNNFTRVNITTDKVEVLVFDENGQELDRNLIYFQNQPKKFTIKSLKCEEVTATITNTTGIGLFDKVLSQTVDTAVNLVKATDDCLLEVYVDNQIKPKAKFTKSMKKNEDWKFEVKPFDYTYRLTIKLFEEDYTGNRLLGVLDILQDSDQTQTKHTFHAKQGEIDKFRYTLSYSISNMS
ncbi:alkaline phosphatase [Kalymmatonema gypsitolerans NIES-4073]|nr:alkaline phosphatase [Scytonema sp. NIES-4073]